MSLLVLIPAVRPSHCPLMRISNVKPAHASDDIYTPRRRTSQGNVNDNLNLNDKGNGYANHNHSTYAKTIHQLNRVHLIIYIKGILAAGGYKINPRERFLLHYRCIKIQIC